MQATSAAPYGIPRTAPHAVLLASAIAAAYFAAGKLALLLAIPPGYATAVWPPAGIALAALLVYGRRYWAGVFVGSLVANLSTSFDATTSLTIARSVAIALTIGAGAALQAVAGATLIRRFAPDSLLLTNERQVFAFYVIAGPLSCATNATIGVATLVVSGAVPLAAAAFNWWTWWVGDSIGALIFTPLLLMWLGDRTSWRARRWAVTIPLLAMLCAAVLVFVYSSRAEYREIRAQFTEDAARISSDIERRLALDTATLRAVGGLFVASEHVEPDEFSRLAALLLPSHPEIRAVGWAPRIDHAEREAFEANLRASGAATTITDLSSGKVVPAAIRTAYVPLLISQSNAGARPRPIGRDLASEPARRAALQRALDSGSLAATRPLVLLEDSTTPDGILIMLPVSDRAGQQPQQVRGFVVGSLRIEQLISHALGAHADASKVTLSIVDVTDGAADATAHLYQSAQRSALPAEHNAAALNLATSRTLVVAGREWQLTFAPTLAYLSGNRSIVAWLVLACGLLLTALVSAGALILTGRTNEVEALVRTRTEELARINEQLAESICDHISTENKLNSEREFLKTVLENLSEGIIVHDAHGTMTMSNRAMRETYSRIVGAAHTDGYSTDRYELLQPDGRTRVPADAWPRNRALRGETVQNFEMIAVADSRAPVSLMVTSQPLVDMSGRRNGAVSLVRDISDAKRAERLKSEFVSVVSHELRTPLTSIRGSIGLVCADVAGVLPDKARQLLEIAYRNTDRLTALINDILDMEKIESGKTQLDMQRQCLAALIDQAMEANAGYAAGCNVQLQLHDSTPSVLVCVDANRLLQVMANLLSNAAKFSPSGAVVDVRISVNATHARVCVRDRGPGVPEEFRERIFQKFSQADGSDSRAKPGTGLGLAISKALIERMGGTIDFESEPGSGATFFFELPLQAAEASLADKPASACEADAWSAVC